MKTKKQETLMIAVHGWDINGAKLAGLNTGFIGRYEKILSKFYMAPNFVEENSYDLINKL